MRLFVLFFFCVKLLRITYLEKKKDVFFFFEMQLLFHCAFRSA